MGNMPSRNDIPTVSELTWKIKDLLEGSFSNITVGGEVSQPVLSRNGHLYFTLKDDGAQIACVAWKSTVQRLKSTLEHGQQINVKGDVQVYAPGGRYQIIVRSVEQAGAGALQQAFERLKAKLEAEGLFAAERKRPLPLFPAVIGVVTSQSGAAFQDIRSTLESRYPLAVVRLYHAAVQGVGAASEIARGIRWFAENGADVLIVGRGGGSLEDLWPFNEEVVARAIAASPMPVVSAVGHETDFSISDFVADVRAATPTQAAVLVSPDVRDLRLTLDEVDRRCTRLMEVRLNAGRDTIRRMMRTHGLMAIRDRMQVNQERLSRYNDRMSGTLRAKLTQRRDGLSAGRRTLQPTMVRSLKTANEQVLAHRKSLLPALKLRLSEAREQHQNPRRALLPALQIKLVRGKEQLMQMRRALPPAGKARVASELQKLRVAGQELKPLVGEQWQAAHNRWQNLDFRLRSVNPIEPLDRGFTRVLQDGKWIRSRSAVDESAALTIQWKDGETKR
jgi:exodeoxyribonuclease VII large subunit